jgi:hypothetical protein
MDLEGVRYDLKKDNDFDESAVSNEEEKASRDADRKDNIGFLAQDVYDVIPEVVNYDDSADIYSVCYTRLIPVLVEAIKEQQAMITTLQEEISLLNQEVEYKSSIVNPSNQENSEEYVSTLMQNQPNPFTEETTINYYLPESINSASLYIYDMTGKQLSNYDLHPMGEGAITISGGKLEAGLYMYSLVADGNLIGTKQMMLTD